ncbi:uncharacterized protein LOC141828834 [Curcuma longa]|uniref:uncharacterized protein LOC141828834 n=1 Tax=Curcuma longa TaxID=136217 RepID=UPI003D9F758E
MELLVKRRLRTAEAFDMVADAAAWAVALSLLVLLLLYSLRPPLTAREAATVRGTKVAERRCEELYVVAEGETVQTIGDKCGDPFIVERNPHVNDPDDVFPGLVLKLRPSSRLP